MAPLRVLCAGVLALAALTAAGARAADAPASTDPVGEAIEKIKTSTATTRFRDLEEPRSFLVDNWQQSLARVLVLLDDNDIQVRINAAIILAKMQQTGDSSPKLLDGLKRCCFNDSVPAVNYWGFVGLMSDNVPAEVARAALKQIINVDRPRPIRLAAIPTLMEKKPKAAIPIIIEHMQNILKDYKTQVQTKVLPEPAAGTSAAAAARPAERPFPAGIVPEAPPAPVQPTRQQIYRKELANLSPEQAQAWIPVVESLAAVKEVHLLGWTLEDLIRTYSADEKSFGFDSTAPWELDQCVERAVLWLQAHKADYEPAAPAPKPAAPPTPTAAPAASPAKIVP